MIILFGKIATAIVWVMMLINLIMPFPSPANVFINGALIFLVVTHGLQAWLLSKTLTKQEREKGNKCLKLFFFGLFEAMSWKKEP